VPKDAKGLTADPRRLVTRASRATSRFDGVEVDADAVIGEVDAGFRYSTRCSPRRTGAPPKWSASAAGAMDLTVKYLKERKQFGKLIGSSRRLQHRAAHLYTEMEVARAAVIKAQQLLDEGMRRPTKLMVSVAKAKAGRAANLAVQRRRADARRYRHDRRVSTSAST
jgi:alkylation response protein AidB-like acyl-CoA dehydrogenase